MEERVAVVMKECTVRRSLSNRPAAAAVSGWSQVLDRVGGVEWAECNSRRNLDCFSESDACWLYGAASVAVKRGETQRDKRQRR